MTFEDIDPAATNHYDILQVSSSLDTDAIRKEVRGYKGKYHPDSTPDISNREYDRVKEAIDVLTDETKRFEYDNTATNISVKRYESVAYVGQEVVIQAEQNEQFIVTTCGNEYRTDGDGNIELVFDSSGHKQIVIDKQDNGTQRYEPKTILIEVKEQEEIPLSMRVYHSHSTSSNTRVPVNRHVTIEVFNEETGEEIKDASVQLNQQRDETGRNGKAKLLVTEPGEQEITCYKEPDDRRSFEAGSAKVVGVRQEKQLDVNINDEKLYQYDTLRIRTKTKDGEPVPNAEVKLLHRGEDLVGESDNMGLFECELEYSGTVRIIVSKDATGDGEEPDVEYRDYEQTIYVKEREQEHANVSIAPPAPNEIQGPATRFNIAITGQAKAGEEMPVHIDLVNRNEYGNGEVIANKTLSFTGEFEENTRIPIESNGTYEIVVNIPGHKQIEEVYEIEGFDESTTGNDDATAVLNSGKLFNSNSTVKPEINKSVSTPNVSSLSTTTIPIQLPLVRTAPKTKTGKFFSIIGLLFFFILIAQRDLTGLMATAGAIALSITYLAPLFIPRIGGIWYFMWIGNMNFFQNVFAKFITNPFGPQLTSNMKLAFTAGLFVLSVIIYFTYNDPEDTPSSPT